MPKQYSAEFKTEVVLERIKNAESSFSTDEQLKEKDRQIEELKQKAADEKLRRVMVEGFLSES